VRLSSLLFQGFWNQIGPLPERLQEHFAQSSRYEYLFWEQAYRQEGWPVQEVERVSLLSPSTRLGQ